MSSKTAEAQELIGKAEKCMKTSLFKRTPDYDSAIEYYTKAAVIYRNAKNLAEAADLYKKVAELQLKVGSGFHCAKNYENAAFIYKDLKDFNQMVELVTKAGDMLRQNGTPDSASYLYERAAKALEQTLPEKAAEFYERSADACEIEEKYHEAADQCNNAARIWVRLRRFADAERLLRLFIDYSHRGNPASTAATLSGVADSNAVPKLCSRAVVVMILMKLHQEDEVAAGKIFSEALERWRFGESDDVHSVQRLLNAVEQLDGDAAAQALKAPCFRNLDLDYVRLIKEIKLPTCPLVDDKDKNREVSGADMARFVPSATGGTPTRRCGEPTQITSHERHQQNVAESSSAAAAGEAEEEEIEEDIC